MKHHIALLACALAMLVTSCGSGEDSAELPAACYGTWDLTGSSGGMDGSGTDVPPGVLLILERGNVAELRTPDEPNLRSEFTVRRGPTIYSSEPGWFLEARGRMPSGVVSVSEDGQSLTIADNTYDGFNAHYRRVE